MKKLSLLVVAAAIVISGGLFTQGTDPASAAGRGSGGGAQPMGSTWS